MSVIYRGLNKVDFIILKPPITDDSFLLRMTATGRFRPFKAAGLSALV
jgi:hypothetical protein